MKDENKETPTYKELENVGLGKLKPERLEKSPNVRKDKGKKTYKGGPENHPGKGL